MHNMLKEVTRKERDAAVRPRMHGHKTGGRKFIKVLGKWYEITDVPMREVVQFQRDKWAEARRIAAERPVQAPLL